MKKIVTFCYIIYFFIFTTIIGMESPSLVNDIWNKIIACTHKKNVLAYTCKTLNHLSKRTNHYIYMHSPLSLSKRDLTFGLLCSIHYGNKPAVKNLLKYGAKPNETIHLSLLPLTLAQYHQNNDLIKLLKKYDAQEYTPMTTIYSLAALIGDLPLFTTHIKKETKLILFKAMYASNPFLHTAIFNGHTHIVEYILQNPTIRHIQNIRLNDMTALYYAALNNRPTIIELLLKAFPHTINDVCIHKLSALHVAVSQKYYNVVKILLNHPDININILDETDNTPLHFAVGNKDVEMVQLLLSQSNIRINIQNKDNMTPLDIADILLQDDIKNMFIQKNDKTYFYLTKIAPWEQNKKV